MYLLNVEETNYVPNIFPSQFCNRVEQGATVKLDPDGISLEKLPVILNN